MKERIIVRCLTEIGYNEFGEIDVDECTYENIEVSSIKEAIAVSKGKDINGEGEIIHQEYDEKHMLWDDIERGYAWDFLVKR